ncbi:MAG: hypothetical protein RL645_1068, partial [Actinomycetota bacterium]
VWAKRMATDHTKRFVPQDWALGPHGLPVFGAATSALIAKIREIHDVENNAVVIVDVLEALVGREDDALLYHHRKYIAPGAELN